MILEIKSMNFSYSSIEILKKINLNINQHELVTILGPNGVGKTTLLKCINKLLKPSSGKILLNGNDILQMSQIEIAKKIGYVSQTNEKYRMTVFDAVMLGRYPYIKWGISGSDLQKVNSIIHILNLEKLTLRFLDELSGGELQKVCVARALVQEPELLLFDEPASNLDLKSQLEIMDLIRSVVTNHKVSAVLTLHDLNTALRYSDRLVFLKSGEIYSYCQPKDITEQLIEDVYGVPVILMKHGELPFIIPKGDHHK